MEVPFTVVVHFPRFLDLLQYFHCCLRQFRFQFEVLSVESSVIINFLVGCVRVLRTGTAMLYYIHIIALSLLTVFRM